MKNKHSSFVFLFSTLFILSGVFLVNIHQVKADTCDDKKKRVIEDCLKKNMPGMRSIAIENKCNEDGEKIRLSCIGSSAAVNECDKQKILDQKECDDEMKARNLDPAQANATCSIKIQESYKNCVGKTGGAFELPSNLDTLNQFQGLTLSEVIGNFMGTAMKILGSIAFALMVGAGLTWMTAGGNSDRQRKALDTMVWAALGVVMILSSATIVKFVFDAFTN